MYIRNNLTVAGLLLFASCHSSTFTQMERKSTEFRANDDLVPTERIEKLNAVMTQVLEWWSKHGRGFEDVPLILPQEVWRVTPNSSFADPDNDFGFRSGESDANHTFIWAAASIRPASDISPNVWQVVYGPPGTGLVFLWTLFFDGKEDAVIDEVTIRSPSVFYMEITR